MDSARRLFLLLWPRHPTHSKRLQPTKRKPRQVQIGGWLDQLTKKAIALQDALSRLDTLLRLWTRTQVSLRASASEPAEDFAAPGEKRDGNEKNGKPP